MEVFEYMKIKYDLIPQEIKEKYNLQEKVTSDGSCVHGNKKRNAWIETDMSVSQ